MSQKISAEKAFDVEYFMKLQLKYLEKYNSFIQWVGASSLAFLPFFVALIPHSPLYGWLLGLYITVVISISLGVLSVCGLLLGQLSADNDILDKVVKVLSKTQEERGSHELSQASFPVYYKISKYSFSISYIIFFISFVTFSILRAF